MKTHSSYIFSEVMAVNRSLTKDIKFYKRVLLRSQQRFLEDLDPVSVLDLFLERDYLTYPQVRDIQEQRLTSDKTREIIKKVSAKGVKGYKTFKALLKESHQGHLAEFLDTQEKTLVKEIKMAEKKEEKDKQALTHETVAPVQQGNQRIPDEQELTSISAHIGMNWELLGPFLGVPTVTIDQIKLDNSTTQVKIYKMLEAWRSRNPLTATVENLVSAMERCPSVRIDWEALRETIGRFTSMDSKTDDLHQSLGARPKTDQLPLQSKTNKNGGKQSVDDLEKSQNSNGIQETSTGHTYGRTVPGDLSINSVARTPVGNTRVNAPDVSNEYGPDLSNQFIREGSDGQKQPQTSHGKTVHYKFSTDPVDARKEQSSKQLFPPIPNPTSFDQFNNMPSSVATPDVIQSLQSIERKIDNIEKATVPVRSEQQSTHIIAYQEKVDIVDGNREREKEKLRKKMIKERDKRLRKLFTSEDDIKGRLKVLRKQDITDLLNCCGCSKAGGFGDIFISKEEIAGLDMKIVIKRVMLKNEADEMKMKSVTSEKLASRTMHFAIVPLLAFMEEPAN
ncbi:uncharacterized protein LOC128552722, partial [Mercenaria mercenaria]|uniref:uncharacterized protein LOC128552722 n=1 Tax=Mercenaria mercenaria TaxID=6596 RepID=UPI00234F2C13